MKKIVWANAPGLNLPGALQILLKMKLTLCIILFSIFGAMASDTYSQTARISLDLKGTTVRDALSAIENQSEFFFLYSEKVIDVERKINIEVNESPIEKMLNKIFEDTDVEYIVKGKQIILTSAGLNSEIEPSVGRQGQKTVTGKVVDNSGVSLPGVSIVVKGTTYGTVTDGNGNYSISNIPDNSILQFSFVGMKSEEVEVGDKSIINVTLIEETVGIEEVVAVGYGTMKKSDLTGAIVSLKNEDMSVAATASVTQMIQGKASGVMIQQLSGQPGGGMKIQIRGESTINSGTEPLYIIDGFPIFNENVDPRGAGYFSAGIRNPLNSINPNDIVSIEILKDAASTSIYGARAANGVVLITTKKGEQGTKISYNGRYSLQKMGEYVKRLDAADYAKYYNMYLYESMLYNKNMYPYGPVTPDPSLYREVYPQAYIDTVGTGTDWLSEIERNGSVNDHNISISGGSEKVKYFSSFGLYDQKGIISSTEFSRLSGRLNLEAILFENVIYGINITGSHSKNKNGTLGGAKWSEAGQLAHALSFPPTIPVYREDGSYTDYTDEPYQFINSAQHNPVSYNDISDVTENNRFLANSYLEITLLKGLKLRPSVGFDKVEAKRDSYIPKTVKLGKDKNGVASIGQGNSLTTMFDATLTYNTIFNNDHELSAMAGYSYQKFMKNGFNNDASGFFTDNLLTNNIGMGNQSTYKIGSYKDESKLASFFGRVNYNFKGKYLLSASLRADGSDKFGEKHRWGYFPGASIGWAAHKEDFLSSVNYLSTLKPRFSVGQSGNASFYGNAFSLYTPDALFAFDGNMVTGVRKTQLENPYLTWETTTEFNYGLDLGFFKNRIFGSLEYFDKRVSDLLEMQRMQIYHEVGYVWQNAGTIQTRGFEFQVNAYAIDREFKWKIDLNFSKYVTKWKERSPDNIIAMSPTDKINDYVRPLYLYQTNHIMMPDEQAPAWMPAVRPGSFIVDDLNGWLTDANGDLVLDENNRKIYSGAPDGKIDEADKVFMGNKDPDFIFGFGNTFEYKHFDLNIFCYGMRNFWFQNENMDRYVLRADYFYNGGYVPSYDYLERYSSFNLDNPKYPANMQNGGGEHESNFNQMWQQISYLRVKNITLGYNIPSRLWGTNIRVFAEATNPFLITNLKDMDPEITNSKDNPNSHGAQGLYAYPNQKTYTFGVDISF